MLFAQALEYSTETHLIFRFVMLFAQALEYSTEPRVDIKIYTFSF